MPQITLANRIAGCLLSGALGDSIGAHYEGEPPGSEFVIPSVLSVTDDTQLTIATCESIIEEEAVQPESIAERFVEWFRRRRITGIGASTLKSLTELDAGGHWALVGATGEYSAGNGAAMRIAPLAFCLDPAVEEERLVIRDVCRITHRNDEAYTGALAVARTMRHVINGHALDDEVLAMLVETLPDSRVRDRMIVVRDASLSIEGYCEAFSASGFVVDSVPLAILSAIQCSDILGTIQRIVQCGGDTDTISSMCGQIYGSAVGAERLPAEIVNQINAVPLIRETAANFAGTSIVKRGFRDGSIT